MSPDRTVNVIVRSLMGDCEFRYDEQNKTFILGEIVTTKDGQRKFISPPLHYPLVRHPDILQYVKTMCYSYLTPDAMFAAVPDPERTATIIGIDISNYLFENYERFDFVGRKQDAHLVRIIIADGIYNRFSGGRGDAFKDMVKTLRQEISSHSENVNREPDKSPFSGIFGRGKGNTQ